MTARLHQNDLARLVADRILDHANLLLQAVGRDIGDKPRAVSGIGFERDDLAAEILDRQHDRIDAGIGADIEKAIDRLRPADGGKVFELLGLPDRIDGDFAVDQIGGVDHEARALRARDIGDAAECAHRLVAALRRLRSSAPIGWRKVCVALIAAGSDRPCHHTENHFIMPNPKSPKASST